MHGLLYPNTVKLFVEVNMEHLQKLTTFWAIKKMSTNCNDLKSCRMMFSDHSGIKTEINNKKKTKRFKKKCYIFKHQTIYQQ